MRTPSSADYRARLAAPTALLPAERKIWTRLVQSVASDHFQECDRPLLTEYVRATHLANQAAEALQNGAVIDGKVSPWVSVSEKLTRALVALSARLRLCPQSRYDRLKAGATSRTGIPDINYEDDPLLAAGPGTGLASFRE